MQKQLDQWVTDFQRFGKINMDFAALQQKLFDLDPSDRAEDLRKLTESVGGMPQESVQTEENFLQESVQVQEGTMPVEGDYSLSDFAALAGVTLNEGFADGFDKNTFNKKELFKKMASSGKSPAKTVPQTQAPASKTVSAGSNEWKTFLKQHTVQLQSIAADPKKKVQFDKFMAKMGEGVEEGDGRKKGIHGKGHPMRKKQQAAIHAGESVESIKEMLLRKLNNKK